MLEKAHSSTLLPAHGRSLAIIPGLRWNGSPAACPSVMGVPSNWSTSRAHTALMQPALTNRLLAMSFRSEEHTSELQSLMRISYAVFCLKKKNTHHTRHRIHSINTNVNIH